MIKIKRVDCPFCGRGMVYIAAKKYLCPARCLTRPITRQEARSEIKKRASQDDRRTGSGRPSFEPRKAC
jgi:hypothetical protein